MQSVCPPAQELPLASPLPSASVRQGSYLMGPSPWSVRGSSLEHWVSQCVLWGEQLGHPGSRRFPTCAASTKSCRPAKCLNQGFSTSALHIWGQVVLSCGVCPVHCRMLSSTPGLCQRLPHLWGAQVVMTHVSADIARCPLGTRSPGWELLAYTQTFSLSGPGTWLGPDESHKVKSTQQLFAKEAPGCLG